METWKTPADADAGRSWAVAALGLVLVVTALRVLYLLTTHLPLAPEEAQYWDWSRRLDWSYYSKPPIIAILIRATTGLLGSTELGVRAGAVAIGALGALAAWGTARVLAFSRRTAFFAVAIGIAVPLYSVGAVILTTDSPLILFWGATVWASATAIFRGRPVAWWMAGLAFGLGLLSKYTMVLLAPCLAAFLLTSPEHRHWMRRAGPWLAIALGLAMFAPVIIWNAAREWVGIRHVIGQTGAARGARLDLASLLEFLGSQLGVVTPLLFAMFVSLAFQEGRLSRLGRDERLRLLAWTSLPVLAAFLVKSAQSKVQANWAAVAYFSGFVLTTEVYFRRLTEATARGRRRRWILLGAAALGLAAAVTLLLHRPDLLRRAGVNLPPKLDPKRQTAGWDRLGEAAGRLQASMPRPKKAFLFSRQYQVTAELAFYAPGQPRTYCVPLGRRMNQYDLWGGWEKRRGDDAIYVVRGAHQPVEPEVAAGFERLGPSQTLTVSRYGRVYAQFTLTPAYGFRGRFPGIADRPQTY